MADVATAEVAEGEDVEASSPPPAYTPRGITIEHVSIEAFDEVWPRVRDWIRDATRWNEFVRKLQTVNDVRERILCQDYKLWVVFREGELIAAVVTGITVEMRCRVVDVCYAGGADVQEWKNELFDKMLDEVEAYDCDFIRIEGREPWGKLLGDLGFGRAYTVFMLEV